MVTTIISLFAPQSRGFVAARTHDYIADNNNSSSEQNHPTMIAIVNGRSKLLRA